MNTINFVDNPSAVKDLTNRYLDKTRLSLRKFAESLSDVMPARFPYPTQAAVGIWSKYGSLPDYFRFYYIYDKTSVGDWRHDFALEMLMTLAPEIWRTE